MDIIMTFALAGVPNCGKTMLFNRLTGGSYRTANRPGVTVEIRRGMYNAGGVRYTLLDLPGMYALSTCSHEEKVALDCLTGGQVDGILAVVDALSPETGLRLCMELAVLGLPMLMVLTRTDLLPRAGITYDFSALSRGFGIPVLPLSAKTGEGLEKLPEGLLSAGLCKEISSDHGENYRKIDEILRRVRTRQDRGESLTDRMDRVLLHPVWGYPIFFLLLTVLLLIPFTLGGMAGDALTAGVERCLPSVRSFLSPWVAEPLLCLTVDGILTGMLSVLSILPTLAILYFCLGCLEDSGYLTRVACLFDPILQKAGLSGRAALPLLLGLGCSVPAVLSTRTLETGSDRRRVIRAIPYLPCSARLPVFLLLSRAFFGKSYPLILLILYLISFLWTAGALILSHRLNKDAEPPALLLELPDYKLPSLTSTLCYVRDRLWEGIRRVGTVIFLSSAFLWILSSYGPRGRSVTDESFLALAGKGIAPLLAPCGLSDWRIAVAILSGFAGKELVISTLSVLFGGSGISEGLSKMGFTSLQAFCLMVFVLLCYPCAGTLSAIRWESGSRAEAIRAVLIGILSAWLVSAAIHALFI